jgi:tRNA (guanosine-2'-O-)-methyltransferase
MNLRVLESWLISLVGNQDITFYPFLREKFLIRFNKILRLSAIIPARENALLMSPKKNIYTADYKKSLISFLCQHMTEERVRRFGEVLQFRTRHIIMAAEDVFQERNASALIRTADCFGIQEVHIIENHNQYKISQGITKGADKWVDVRLHQGKKNNTENCIIHLRERGYRIVASSPHRFDQGPEQINLDQKTAIFFGGEKEGLSETVINQADSFLKIPMVGFTESFNLSVAGGIIMYTLAQRLRNSNIPWQLTEDEKDDLRINWALNTINRSDQLVKKFHQQYNFPAIDQA